MSKLQFFKYNYLLGCIIINLFGVIPILLDQPLYIAFTFFGIADVALPLISNYYWKKNYKNKDTW